MDVIKKVRLFQKITRPEPMPGRRTLWHNHQHAIAHNVVPLLRGSNVFALTVDQPWIYMLRIQRRGPLEAGCPPQPFRCRTLNRPSCRLEANMHLHRFLRRRRLPHPNRLLHRSHRPITRPMRRARGRAACQHRAVMYPLHLPQLRPRHRLPGRKKTLQKECSDKLAVACCSSYC